jgi:hypothetical protein
MAAKSCGTEPHAAPNSLVQGLTLLAERHAHMTADWLESNGFSAGSYSAPASFLFELAAVLQLGAWERQGIFDHASLGLPTYREAADDLAARAARGPSEFHGRAGRRLSTLVNQSWMDRFAWDGPALLSADIIFGECDDEMLIEQLAQFLWQHQAELGKNLLR